VNDFRILGLATAVISFALAGCVSFTTAQTARTLKQGQTAGYAGFIHSSETSETEDEDDGVEETTEDETRMTGFVVGARYGLTGEFDIGARGSNLGVTMIDTKLQLASTRTFAAAVGFGLGIGTWDTESKTKADGEESSTSESDGMIRVADVPFYLSTDPTPDLSLYGALRYVYVHNESDSGLFGGDGDEETSSSRVIGLTGGVLTHGRPGFFGELSLYMSPDKDTDTNGLQVAAGVTFNQP
jgi:hypothetical protein